MEWTLGLDTSTSRAFAALVGDAPGECFEETSGGENSHHEEVAVLTEKVLSRAGISPRGIGRVVVGGGPGSFTGLRIGYSFARGLSSSLGVPMFGVSSLLALAWEFRSRADVVVSSLDARRDELFVGVFRSTGEQLTPCGGAAIVRVEDLERHVRDLTGESPRTVYVGRGGPTPLVASRVGLGVVEGWLAEGRTAPRSIDSEPEYLRVVAAKTIAERRGAAQKA